LTTAADVGAAQIVSKFSESFDLAALFSLTDKAVLDNDEEEEMAEDARMEGIDVDADADMNADADADADITQDEPILRETYVQSSPLRCTICLTYW
jgi:hypothetical protein